MRHLPARSCPDPSLVPSTESHNSHSPGHDPTSPQQPQGLVPVPTSTPACPSCLQLDIPVPTLGWFVGTENMAESNTTSQETLLSVVRTRHLRALDQHHFHYFNLRYALHSTCFCSRGTGFSPHFPLAIDSNSGINRLHRLPSHIIPGKSCFPFQEHYFKSNDKM